MITQVNTNTQVLKMPNNANNFFLNKVNNQQFNSTEWFQQLFFSIRTFFKVFSLRETKFNYKSFSNNLRFIGINSINVILVTSLSLSFILTFQVGQPLFMIHAEGMISPILTMTLIREFCPVVTGIILAGKVGSAFTAEIATMKVTEELNLLYILRIDPIDHLVIPKVYACIVVVPILNFLSIISSLAGSMFSCCLFYNIHPHLFATHTLTFLNKNDVVISSIKSVCFGISITTISCSWGLHAEGGAKGVGKFTTSSVVTTLLCIFCSDFILSYYLFKVSLKLST